jgi:hypothetical protein
VEQSANYQGARAVANALYRLHAQAQTNALTASTYQSRDADYGPALAFAILNSPAQARKLTADVQTRYPEYTSAQFSYLPTLRALEALNRGDAAQALAATQAASMYELAIPGTAYYVGGLYGALYPVYVRGLAYTRLGRHREAATEFQKILDNPGRTLSDPVAPMARLQLARSVSASGDRARAAAIYRDLLALWKDADPEVPVVQQAKAEYAKLQPAP